MTGMELKITKFDEHEFDGYFLFFTQLHFYGFRTYGIFTKQAPSKFLLHPRQNRDWDGVKILPVFFHGLHIKPMWL